jgi:hypothetical protein
MTVLNQSDFFHTAIFGKKVPQSGMVARFFALFVDFTQK